MKAIEKNLYARGKSGIKYCRRRIPTALLQAYPPKQTHVTRSLDTADIRLARQRLNLEMVRIDAEFEQMAEALRKKHEEKTRTRLEKLSEAQLKNLGDYWVRNVLEFDQYRRDSGMNDEEFDALDATLVQQRHELGRMLATGRSEKILPAMHGFIHLCGLDVTMSPEESTRAGQVFLASVVASLDHQLKRQGGSPVKTDEVAPPQKSPKELAHPEKPPMGWETAFNVWRDYVPERPKSTTIATRTPWNELRLCAQENGINCPEHVTPELMRIFVDRMAKHMVVITLNERLAKIKALFKVLKGKGVVSQNPCLETIGLKENSYQKRTKTRLPFDQDDVQTIFSSVVFNEAQLRSQGQSGEASYWIPILMLYTGARPEELAGLAVDDIVQHSPTRWYLNIIDRPSAEVDVDLYSADELKELREQTASSGRQKSRPHARLLKNQKSIRKVPVAQELIDLGLLRYIAFVRGQGQEALFPGLTHDFHGKLSGAFSKFFGRYKTTILKIQDKRKVLYSFRHAMKDAMTRAHIPTKQLQRVLGHASGDGEVTDGYGVEDVQLDAQFMVFQKIKFFDNPAKPWEPGKGVVSLRTKKPGPQSRRLPMPEGAAPSDGSTASAV